MPAPIVALDLDGTLLDCRPRQVAVAVAVAGPLDEDRLWADKRAGATTRQALEAQGMAPGAAARAAEAWVAQVEDDRWLGLDPLLPGARAALNWLRRRGTSAVVVTARRRAGGPAAQLARLGVAELVDGIEVVPPSEAAHAKAEVLRRLGACAYVGDAESDAQAAADAGVPFVAVTGGQRSGTWLAERGISPRRPDVRSALRLLLEP